MAISGHLKKMESVLGAPVSYALRLEAERVLEMNPLIGRSLELRYLNEIHCIHCGRKTSKSFNQGYCYPCFTKLAQCDMCIVKPELCHFDAGTCREPEWGMGHCMQPHVVYLANSSGVKVGITRRSQIPTRWIDQGAVAALPIVNVASRYLAGLVEVTLKAHVADRTNWQKMLKNQVEPVDLLAQRDLLLELCSEELAALQARFGSAALDYPEWGESQSIEYPVMEYPKKVKALNLDKTPQIEGTLLGIKGQYLIFDCGVINIRKFAGYAVEIAF